MAMLTLPPEIVEPMKQQLQGQEEILAKMSQPSSEQEALTQYIYFMRETQK